MIEPTSPFTIGHSPHFSNRFLSLVYGFYALLRFTAHLFQRKFPKNVGSQFKESYIYVGWIAFGYVFHGMYLMVAGYIFYMRKTKYIALITVTVAIVNLLLNYWFIQIYGAIGVAYATTIGYFCQFVATWFLSAKVKKMPWSLKNELLLKKNRNNV
jgi:Na+-driven multidrug efflux pump